MSLSLKILDWLAGADTGKSSRAIVAWLERDLTVSAMIGNIFAYPCDPADLGRCIRLLDIEPAYRSRILEMSAISPQWARLAANWDALEKQYARELPSGHARRCYDMMRALIEDRPLPVPQRSMIRFRCPRCEEWSTLLYNEDQIDQLCLDARFLTKGLLWCAPCSAGRLLPLLNIS